MHYRRGDHGRTHWQSRKKKSLMMQLHSTAIATPPFSRESDKDTKVSNTCYQCPCAKQPSNFGLFLRGGAKYIHAIPRNVTVTLHEDLRGGGGQISRQTKKTVGMQPSDGCLEKMHWISSVSLSHKQTRWKDAKRLSPALHIELRWQMHR